MKWDILRTSGFHINKMLLDNKIFFTLFFAVFVTTMGAGMVAPLLPVYAHDLGAGAFEVGLIFAAFSLTRTIFVPYFGKLSDKTSKKNILISGLFFYFIISLFYSGSTHILTLIFLRLCQGTASAMVLPVAQTYVGLLTPESKEGQVMGFFNISLYAGLSAGPLLGGFIKDLFNIRVSFFSMGFFALIGFMLCLFLLPYENKNRVPETSRSSGNISLIKMLRSPAVFSLFLFRSCFTFCIGIMWTFLPLLASIKFNLSSSAIGFLVTVNVLVAAVLQIPMGYAADRVNKKILVGVGAMIGILSILYMDFATSFTGLAISNAGLGISGGIALPSIMALGVIEGKKLKAMGSIMGLLALAHSLGMLIAPLLGGLVIDLFSFRLIFILSAIMMAIGSIMFIRSHIYNV